ncbi:FkbM family methyltransferase [Tepidibacter sp. Z1-5]|uniref:FkbM family methyltransferase n=1 Tax=Tepidibacter sp. Z1-5 TaxID=3134138 RepID=UPI0030C4C53B
MTDSESFIDSMFIEKIIDSPNIRNLAIKELKQMKQKNIPIVCYGAGGTSQDIKEFLEKNDLNIDAYFVDDEYYDENSYIDSKKIYKFDQITHMYDKFNIVIGFLDCIIAKQNIDKKQSNKIVNVYSFECNFMKVFSDFNLKYIKENLPSFQIVYKSLNDDLSKKVFIDFINCKITGNLDFVRNKINEDQYFIKEIMPLSNNEVFVDAGAFDGDTLLSFLEKTNYNYGKYYGFEPDYENYKKLDNLTKNKSFKNIHIYNKGLYETSKTLCFFSNGKMNSSIDIDGNIQIQVDCIDNLCSDATFIKMDIEGAELEALKGAKKAIKKNRPKLAICIYHKPEHLYKVALFIKSIATEYKLYLRHHCNNSNELVLYATI